MVLFGLFILLIVCSKCVLVCFGGICVFRKKKSGVEFVSVTFEFQGCVYVCTRCAYTHGFTEYSCREVAQNNSL